MYRFQLRGDRTFVAVVTLAAAATLLIWPAAAHAQPVYFTDKMASPPVLAASQTPGAWYVDRYAPASFECTTFQGQPRLRLGISADDSTANRPATFGSAFYNTQGRKIDISTAVGSYIAGDLYIGTDWETQNRRSDLWATTFGASLADPAVAYPIIGFVHNNDYTPAQNGFRVYDQTTGWQSVPLPDGFTYGSWHTVRIELHADSFKYFIDGQLAYTDPVTKGSVIFGNMMIQAYNFGDEGYDAYWDNIASHPIGYVEPTARLTYLAGTHGSIVGSSTQVMEPGSDCTTVTAVPDAQYRFVGWSDGVTTADRRETSVMVDTTITANFSAEKSVIRLSGSDRYGTAIAAALDVYPGWSGVHHVVVASGQPGHEPDALTGAGLAGAYDCPLLLVPTNYVPGSVRSAIAGMPKGVHVHIVGGPSAISDKVSGSLRAISRVSSVDRTSGADRYATGAAVATRMKSVLGNHFPRTALLANGQSPAYMLDPLIASTASFSRHFPVLLLSNRGVPPTTAAALSSLGLSTRFVVGGTAAVSESTRRKLCAAENRISGADVACDSVAFAARAKSLGWLTDEWVGFAAKVPDAATGGAFMAKRGGPLLVVQPSTVPAVTSGKLTADKLGILGGYLFGGPLAVTETVRTDLEGCIK